jgi:C-terminal processing protease CtpA/Prc
MCLVLQRRIRVRKIVPGTAAERARAPFISVGDELVRISNEDIQHLPIERICVMLMGTPGNTIRDPHCSRVFMSLLGENVSCYHAMSR